MKDVDDNGQVAACIDGDTEAFSVLVDRHRDAVFNLAYRLCGNAASAEDIAQEAFIRAFRKLPQFKPELSFRNWVMGICANLARSRYRRWRRRSDLEQAYVDETDRLRAEQDETEAAGVDQRARVEAALMALPQTLRAPVVLKYMEGMSVRQIAETLHIRLSAAKMRLARGRERLLGHLKGKGKESEP